MSGTGRAVFLSNCKPRSYCLSYCITATGNIYFALIFFFLVSLLSFTLFLSPSVCTGLETVCMLDLVHFCLSVELSLVLNSFFFFLLVPKIFSLVYSSTNL